MSNTYIYILMDSISTINNVTTYIIKGATMVKSVLIQDEVHNMLIKKQTELLKKDIRMGISKIAENAILLGIENVGETKK